MDQPHISEVVIFRLSRAIAKAEGFFRDGTRPARNHNPGDLELDTTGKGIGFDGPYVIYRSDPDGWAALEHQVRLMLSGRSHVYRPTMTIEEMGRRYTETDQDVWIQNVSGHLRVPRTTRLCDLV